MTPADRKGRGALLAICLLCLAALGAVASLRPQATPSVHAQTLYVFGTLLEIVIHGEEPAVAQTAVAGVGQQLQSYHDAWHGWRAGELTALNAAIARGEDLTVSADLAALLEEAQQHSVASGGLFEPAIGRLIALWGFHSDTVPTGAPPKTADIAPLVAARPRIADLRIDGRRVSSDNPAVQLDLGAFAKGVALERAADLLMRDGIGSAILNAGGDVLVLGRHGARDWRVAVRNPFGWGVVATLAVRSGEAVFTSGNYERFLEHDGARFSHILDPRTGRPVEGIVSATVLHSDAGLADAAATALSVAGPDGWKAVAEAMGIELALLIDNTGRLHVTPAMSARLEHPPAGATARENHRSDVQQSAVGSSTKHRDGQVQLPLRCQRHAACWQRDAFTSSRDQEADHA